MCHLMSFHSICTVVNVRYILRSSFCIVIREIFEEWVFKNCIFQQWLCWYKMISRHFPGTQVGWFPVHSPSELHTLVSSPTNV